MGSNEGVGLNERPASRFRVLASLASASLLAPLLGQIPAGSGDAYPGLPQTSIQHVVIILKENRSFDQYFGRFPGADGATTGVEHDGTVVNLGPTPEPLPNDIGHSVSQFSLAYDGGKMDGFDLEDGAFSQTGQNLAYTQMTQAQIPNYWAYGLRYAIGDHMFSDFHGASFGNNVASVAAQYGQYDSTIGNRAVYTLPNTKRPGPRRWGCDQSPDGIVELIGPDSSLSAGSTCFNFPSLPNILSQNGVSWNYYGDATKEDFVHNGLDAIRSVRYNTSLWDRVVPLSRFTTDAQSGNLPAVSWVLGDNLEHPPQTACAGENETVQFVNAIMQGPDWSSTAIFVYWDEWGGFYDHEPPPQVDNTSYGIRVPLLVISPWTKYGASSDGGSISSTFYSQASTLKFVEDNWSLPALTPRDAGANDMMDMFDFSQVPKDPLLLTARSCAPLTAAARALLASRDPD